jgi:phosphoserine phosphatase RsbU/P
MEPKSASARLLIVDDEKAVLQAHARTLSEYDPLRAEDGIAARAILTRTDVDVVLCDLSMPRLGGLDLMRWAKDHCPRPLWIVVSAQDTFDAATQALKLGAFDFLCKPMLPIQLRTAVANAIRHQHLLGERASLARGLAENNLRLAESLRELETAYGVLRDQQWMLDQDIRRAGRIMRALLPPVLPKLEGMQLSVGYRPSHIIGGDLYGAAMRDDHHLAIYVADAAGHGVSAALLAVLFKQRLRLFEAGSGPQTPAALLAELNRGLFDECRASGLFVTVIFALIDTAECTATIASAGHPPALWFRSTLATEHLEKTGPALGLVHDATFKEHRVSLADGDRLFFFTDGLTGALPAGGPGLDATLGTIGAEEKDGGRAINDLLNLTERSGTCDDDVTLLLLTASRGASSIDADRETTLTVPQTECVLRVGVTEGTTWIAARGHVIWKAGPALREACLKALEGDHNAVVDLGACTMLDSTVLGTLHELVARTEPSQCFRIQNVSDDLRRLFVELAMAKVLSCVVEGPQPLPAQMTDVPVNGDAKAHALVLRAHELLAELSPRNAEEFAPVIDALRQG